MLSPNIMGFDFARHFLIGKPLSKNLGGRLGNETHSDMEKLGYIISEAPVLFLMIWFAVRMVQYRRRRRLEPIFSAGDKALLFPPNKISLSSPIMRVKFARCILLATAATYLEFLVLAPFGAAILCVALTLTTAAIVHRVLLSPA